MEFKQNPRLSSKEAVGTGLNCKIFSQYPHDEVRELLKNARVEGEIQYQSSCTLPVEGLALVTACLDVFNGSLPEVLPVWPEMEGHEVNVVIYSDTLGCIYMIAVGGYTTLKTRNSLS